MISSKILSRTSAMILATATFLGMSVKGTGEQAEKPQIRYRVVDIGTLPDCNVTCAESINDEGRVVGYAYKIGGAAHGEDAYFSRPFVWHNGKILELPKLGGQYGRAITINANGDIGGYAETAETKKKGNYSALILACNSMDF